MRIQSLLVAEKDECDIGMMAARQGGAGHNHLGAVISPHGVDRDPHWPFHVAPAASVPPARRRDWPVHKPSIKAPAA